MGTLMKDGLFNAQLIRALGYAAYGGADLDECLATAARIHGTDLTSWYDEWTATAQRVLAQAQASLPSGHTASAQSGFFRASNYFRTAGLVTMGIPLDPRLVDSHAREVESFRSGAALLARPPEIVSIPYEESSLPGYFFRVADDDRPRPTLILTNGYDGTAEELYLVNGAAALARGYNVLTFDGPGQGELIIDRGIPFRPDWENVVTPIVDFLHDQPGVDRDRIALMGLSLGGYLAPRAATGEHRLAACISDCGPYDVFEVIAARLPGILAKQLPHGNATLLRLLSRLLAGVVRKPTGGWALRRSLLVHGLSEPLDYFRLAPEYSLRGIEHLIQCPTFVCSVEGDDLSANAPKLYEALTCPKEYVRFGGDAAGLHCESGARTTFHRRAFDWLDEILVPVDPRPEVQSGSLGSTGA